MRKRSGQWLGLGLATAGLGIGLTVATSTAQVSRGKTRPARTSQLMEGIVEPHFNTLRRSLRAEPRSDAAWDELALHAAVLNEISYVLMDDGRPLDRVWEEAASQTLRQATADVLVAIEARDFALVQAAGGAIGDACRTCHDAHRRRR